MSAVSLLKALAKLKEKGYPDKALGIVNRVPEFIIPF